MCGQCHLAQLQTWEVFVDLKMVAVARLVSDLTWQTEHELLSRGNATLSVLTTNDACCTYVPAGTRQVKLLAKLQLPIPQRLLTAAWCQSSFALILPSIEALEVHEQFRTPVGKALFLLLPAAGFELGTPIIIS